MSACSACNDTDHVPGENGDTSECRVCWRGLRARLDLHLGPELTKSALPRLVDSPLASLETARRDRTGDNLIITGEWHAVKRHLWCALFTVWALGVPDRDIAPECHSFLLVNDREIKDAHFRKPKESGLHMADLFAVDLLIVRLGVLTFINEAGHQILLEVMAQRECDGRATWIVEDATSPRLRVREEKGKVITEYPLSCWQAQTEKFARGSRGKQGPLYAVVDLAVAP